VADHASCVSGSNRTFEVLKEGATACSWVCAKSSNRTFEVLKDEEEVEERKDEVALQSHLRGIEREACPRAL